MLSVRVQCCKRVFVYVFVLFVLQYAYMRHGSTGCVSPQRQVQAVLPAVHDMFFALLFFFLLSRAKAIEVREEGSPSSRRRTASEGATTTADQQAATEPVQIRQNRRKTEEEHSASAYNNIKNVSQSITKRHLNIITDSHPTYHIDLSFYRKSKQTTDTLDTGWIHDWDAKRYVCLILGMHGYTKLYVQLDFRHRTTMNIDVMQAISQVSPRRSIPK